MSHLAPAPDRASRNPELPPLPLELPQSPGLARRERVARLYRRRPSSPVVAHELTSIAPLTTSDL